MVVEQVDLTDDVISVNNISLFNKHIADNKTAKITLRFIDKQSETLTFALPVKLSIEKQNNFTTKVKESIASLLSLFIGEAHADSLLPVTQLPYCSIYTPDPDNCKSATHLFSHGFIDNLKQVNSKAKGKTDVKKNF
jgi:hypothetical protein